MKTDIRKNEAGLSLLEIVIAVAIIAIFSAVSIISYRTFTDNARQAAVDTAARQVFTAAMSQMSLPARQSSHVANTLDNDYPAAFTSGRHSTFMTTMLGTSSALQNIANEYNASAGNEIQVDIQKDAQNLTVIAIGWDGDYIAVRSTDASIDGIQELPDDYTPTPEHDENASEDPLEDENGVFRFTTGSPNSYIFFDGVTEGTTISYNDTTYLLEEGEVLLPVATEYTVKGSFQNIGNKYTSTDVILVSEWKDTGTTDASYAFSEVSQILTSHRDTENSSNVQFASHKLVSSEAEYKTIFETSPPSTIVNMEGMFTTPTHLRTRVVEGVSQWKVSNVKNMARLFDSVHIQGEDFSDWQVGNVENMEKLFAYTQGGIHGIQNWDVSKVKNMSGMFLAQHNFNIDISGWTTDSLENMESMFYYAYAFNQPIGSWNVSNVTNMQNVFADASNFNRDLSNWEVSNVTTMNGMFRNATQFNQDISTWDVSSVKDINTMFQGASSFNNGGQPLNWGDKTQNIESMVRTFASATSFNQDISNWNVSNVGPLQSMNFSDNSPIHNTSKEPSFIH